MIHFHFYTLLLTDNLASDFKFVILHANFIVW